MSGASKKLMGITPFVGAVGAQAVDFDGTNDYLIRSFSAGTFGSGSKTVTFSAWFYWSGNESETIFSFPTFSVTINAPSGNLFSFSGFSNTYATLLGYQTNAGIAKDTWNHALFSFDLSNSANRHVYINDVAVTGTFTSYLNTAIGFDVSGPATVSATTSGPAFSGRLSNVYLDYTYRDLSVEANRRLFITDEGTPASGQASLSPILYLPMDDPADVGRNNGTSGNFTLNGIVARSGRGPNQYNAPASTFDGSGDYLSRAALSGSSTSKTITGSVWFKDGASASDKIFTINTTDVNIAVASGEITIFFSNGPTDVMRATISKSTVQNRWYHLTWSFDVSDVNKRHFYIDGVDVGANTSFSAYSNIAVDISGITAVGADGNGNEKWEGEIAEFYFDDSYIDLSLDNPFYDTETGKPKFLGEFGELPTGSAPLIYLPLRADDAGNNKGTGGDFTVNSGPYVGARGPSEFWGEAAEFNGTNQSLSRTSTLTGSADGKVVTFVGAFKLDATASRTLLLLRDEGLSQGRFSVEISTTGFEITARTSSNTSVLFVDGTWSGNTTDWHTIAISFDFSNVSNRHIYINGTSISGSYSTYSDLSAGFSANGQRIARNNGTNYLDGKIGFLWFNTEYIDFSQEANRLKFFDAFGYPADVGADGGLPTGNVPLIYMNEDFHLGTNYGSGGNFTPVNAPTDGGYVKG